MKSLDFLKLSQVIGGTVHKNYVNEKLFIVHFQVEIKNPYTFKFLAYHTTYNRYVNYLSISLAATAK